MISTVSDLLDALKIQETKLLDEQNIVHAPTIGSMYEGLTKNILEQALPSNLDLRVISGFITNDQGKKSKQIDCMLVDGSGEKIPYTNEYVYDIRNVIAVIEVKKNLYSDDLGSAYKNLASVRRLQTPKRPMNRMFIDSYRQILQSDPRDCEDINRLPNWKKQLGFVLYHESILPIRIALGYHGFSSELGFREAFIKYLERNVLASGFSPIDFPNLIISNQYSLIKLTGMPYGIPIFKERKEVFASFGLSEDPEDIPPINSDLWACYASYPAKPMLLLLQLLWTRLQYIEKVSGEIFGLDLDIEILRPLILAKSIEKDNETGWHYEYFYLGQKFLDSIPLSVNWEPVEINKEQWIILAYLGNQEYTQNIYSLSIHDSGLLEQIEHPNLLMENLNLLIKTNLVSLENEKIGLLTEECQVVTMPDGRIFAWDGSDPRFMDWLMMNKY